MTDLAGLSWDLDSDGLKAFAQQVGEAWQTPSAHIGTTGCLVDLVNQVCCTFLSCQLQVCYAAVFTNRENGKSKGSGSSTENHVLQRTIGKIWQVHSNCIPFAFQVSHLGHVLIRHDLPRICRDRPLGFGFRGKVQFASSEFALRAIDELNGRELLGREAMQRSDGRERET